MKNLLKYTTILILFPIIFSSKETANGKTLHIKELGMSIYSYQNYSVNFQTALLKCKNEGYDTLALDCGRYDIWPEGAIRKELYISNTSSENELPSKVKAIGLYLDNINNLTVEGNGATLMFHGSMTPVALYKCSNIKIHNLHIDFERPGGSEATIVEIGEDHTDVKFHKDSRYEIDNDGKIILFGEGWKSSIVACTCFDPETKHYSRCGAWHSIKSAKAIEIGENIVRFMTKCENIKPGYILTLRDIIRHDVGLFINESDNTTIDSVFMHYMHGLGMISQRSSNITMQSVRCAPREGSGRVLASSADFMHFSGCKGLIKIHDCYFCGAQDDCVNIHGTDLKAIEKLGDNKLKVRFMHDQSYGFDVYSPGDSIAFLQASTMQRIGFAKVESFRKVNEYEIEITLDRNLPKDYKIGEDCIENYTYTPSVDIRRNYFSGVSTRGVLLTTPKKAVISDNIFFGTGMAAILIEGDAKGWFECGTVKDVQITRNKFIDCNFSGGAAIVINPSNNIIDPKKPVHENIRILNNYFDLRGRRLIEAKSTSRLIIKDNEIVQPAEEPVVLNGCSKTEIQKIPDNQSKK